MNWGITTNYPEITNFPLCAVINGLCVVKSYYPYLPHICKAVCMVVILYQVYSKRSISPPEKMGTVSTLTLIVFLPTLLFLN